MRIKSKQWKSIRKLKLSRGDRMRTEETLHRLHKMRRNRKKLHLAKNKSFRKKLDRSNLNVENGFPVIDDSAIQPVPGSHSFNRHSYNVYSYYYPKYDMSYGHCLYVTPWILQVPADSIPPFAQLAGADKQERLLSLERNWKMIGWKRRVNSRRRSFTFPTNADWESTIYYFPRWDLSFYPLPISKIRPQIGAETAFPVDTVLEEEEEDSKPLGNLSRWKDHVEFEEGNEQDESCVLSTSTALSSRSPSPSDLTSTLSESYHSLGQFTIMTSQSAGKGAIMTLLGVRRGALMTSPRVVAYTQPKSPCSPIHEDVNNLQICQSRLNEFESEQEVEELRFSNSGEMNVEGARELNPVEDFRRTRRQINSPHQAFARGTHGFRFEGSPTQLYEQISHRKSLKIELIEKSACKSLSEVKKSRSCAQRKPSKSLNRVRNNLDPSEDGSESGLFRRKPKTEENELDLSTAAAFWEDENKQESKNESSGVDVQRKSNTAGRTDHRIKGHAYRCENASPECNMCSENIAEPRVPSDLGNIVSLEGGMKPGENATVKSGEHRSATTTDDLVSTNNIDSDTLSIRILDDTNPERHLEGDFISGCCDTNAVRDTKGNTFSIPLASMKETKQLSGTLQTQVFTSCDLKAVDPLRVDRSIERSSFSVTNGFVCKSEMVVQSSEIFDVEGGNHIRNKSVQAGGMNEESHQTLCVPQSRQSCMHSIYTIIKEESLDMSIMENKKTYRKRSKVERKTAMRKLVFVRSSSVRVSDETRAEDTLSHDYKLTEGSTDDTLQRRHNGQNTVQTTRKQTHIKGNDWCKSGQVVEFAETDSLAFGEDIKDVQKPRLRMLQDQHPVASKTYLSIWQNRRARYDEFLKRNPALIYFPSQPHIIRNAW